MVVIMAGIYFMYVIQIRNMIPWTLSILLLSIFTLFFVDSFYELYQGQTLEEINKYKRRLYYCELYFSVDYPYLQHKEIIYWNSIEAIFLSHSPPLDNEYYNFEYSIILNSEPKVVKYEAQNWLNKYSFFPKPKSKGLPILTIRDDDNRDFQTLRDAIHKYLLNKENLNTPIMSFGLYRIFDKYNLLTDETLVRLRQESQNQ